MLIQPTLNRVLIRPLEQKEEIAGIEIVRDGQSGEMKMGVVEEAGSESTIPKGTKVMYNPAAGTLLKRLVNGSYQNLRIMLCDTIQCIFSEQ